MSASGRIAGLYERHALAYDRDRSRSLFERSWLDAFLGLLPPGGSVLDIGCGMGEPIAAYVIARGHPVTGIDASPTLIELCRRRHPSHAWHVGDMRSLTLGGVFTGLIAWDSLFHLNPDDQRALFPWLAAHAAPAAALLFTSGPVHGLAIGVYRGEALYHASLAPDEYRALLAASGFAVVRHVAEDPTCGGHTVWLARRD